MTIEEFIKSHNVDYSNNRVTERELEEILDKTKLEFGPQLKEYILKYGYLGYEYMEFDGLVCNLGEKSPMFLDSLKLHQRFDKTNGLIVLENQGDGDYYLVDSGDNVFRFILDTNELINLNMKLNDYILKRFLEVKENCEKESTTI